MLYFRHLDISEPAGAFLAVSANKRHGAAVFKQFCAVKDLPGLHAQKVGYVIDVDFFH